jgi:curli biogenesis system outer membrane secretion channel CsgG
MNAHFVYSGAHFGADGTRGIAKVDMDVVNTRLSKIVRVATNNAREFSVGQFDHLAAQGLPLFQLQNRVWFV